ncbi:MAG: DUF3800 domain-containing protein [Deltaproteobacteria bacterium]|nr:DUF3800 domain-containing protein [Deltaproteobacteria bacterium]MBF0526483.1 DUF3800 domain-containing protein [Deltaproteobacteria bacterium]
MDLSTWRRFSREGCIRRSAGANLHPATEKTPLRVVTIRGGFDFLFLEKLEKGMYFLYLDDSGSVANRDEEYFVLAGVCVPENSVPWLNAKIEDLAAEIPLEDPGRVEFHAADIFGGKKPPWDMYSVRIDRINLIKKVLYVLQKAYQEIVIFACAIHKKSYPKVDAFKLSFEDLCSRFNLYLHRMYQATNVPQKGIIVLDKCAHEMSLQQLALEFRQVGTRWGHLKNIIEVPFFVDSRSCRLIQLADHIAYAVFRRYNADDLTYFNCIEGRFDRHDGIIHGLVHKQLCNQTCTCPACLTRNQ